MTFHDETMPDDVSDDEAYMLTERHAPALLDECLAEFGPHDDHSNCAGMLATMNDGYYDHMEWEAEQYNREAEENMLGRPLFPNEY